VAHKGEVQEGCERLKEEQGTRADEFRAECLQAMDDLRVNYIIKLYGASIALEYVSAKWREVTVIFIPKPGKSNYTDKRAFLPISLMSVDNFLKMYDNSAIKSIGFADNGTLLITGICIKTIYNIMQKLVLWHIEETNLTDRPMHESQ
jgi:hypothetical protein